MTQQAARPLTVTFIYHPADETAAGIVEAASALAEGLGAERAGIFMRVPVRVRSEPLGPGPALRPVLPESSVLDVVIFCLSAHVDVDPAPFHDLLNAIHKSFADPDRLLFIPLFLGDLTMPAGFDAKQGIRWYQWHPLEEHRRRTRALIRIVTEIRNKLDRSGKVRSSTIFVSHAKRDGRDMAEDFVRHVRDPQNQLGLETFYDALELRDGENFAEGLDAGVRDSALLALVSDSYEGRPWCNREILVAKEFRRPVLIVDVGRRRVARTYPYLGNLPFRRHDLATPEGRDSTILDLVVEMLRVELFAIVAHRVDPQATALPRPPELLDLVALVNARAERVLYPDPPLPDQELNLLTALVPGMMFSTLDEMRP